MADARQPGFVVTDHVSSKSNLLFPPTSWSLLARTQQSAAVTPAVSEFADVYYGAVRAFISSIVRDAVEAQDLTQKFFLSVVLEGRLLQRANPSEGRFREYLKQAVRNFLVDDHRYRTRKKRRADESDLRPDSLKGGWEAVAHQRAPAQDKAFLRGWAQGVVRTAIERVSAACREKGQEEHFQLFAGRYLAAGEMPSWRAVGEPFGLDEKTARSRAETVARSFRTVIRELVATDSGSAERTDDEISELISLF